MVSSQKTAEKLAAAPESVHVGLITAGFLKRGEEYAGLLERACAMLGDNIEEGALGVFAHRDGAADIDMRALGDPAPEIAAGLAHPVLHVELSRAVARPGQRQVGEKTSRVHTGKLVLVEEIAVAPLMTEEQPIFSGRLRCPALVQKG